LLGTVTGKETSELLEKPTCRYGAGRDGRNSISVIERPRGGRTDWN
jgi:hypothetical protein